MPSQGVAEPPQLEARAYGSESSERDIEKLRAQVYEYAPGVVMYREAPVLSLFQIEVYQQKFYELADSFETFDLVIDLTHTTGRPDAAMRARLKEIFLRPKNMNRIVVFTGRNFLLNMAAKFVLGGLGLKSLTVVRTKEEALEAIEHGA